jgi:ABC-type transport system involved in multi-copper enzyme maturation permease subunit
MSTLAVARIFFREAIRDRILNLIWLFAIAMLGLSLFMGDLSAGSELKVVKDLGLGIINMLLVLVAIMIGANSIYREIDKRTIYVVLAKPIARWQFLVGKFMGLFGVLVLLAVAMGAAYYLLLFVMVRERDPIYLPAIALMLLEASVIAALAILFSAITSPTLSAIYVLGVYLVGHNTEAILHFGDRGEAPAYVRAIGRVLYHVLPNLETLNIKNQVVYGAGIGGLEAAWAVAYAVGLVAVFMTLATWAFVTREI